MKAKKGISPEDYILSALTPEERLEMAFKLAGEVFQEERAQKVSKMVKVRPLEASAEKRAKKAGPTSFKLSPQDIKEAVKEVRREIYERRRKKEKGGG